MSFGSALLKLSFFVMFLAGAFPTFAQLNVYENSAHWSGRVFVSSNEFGDEVILAGNARVITRIAFECRGDFTPPVVGHARLRLYSNDGPRWQGSSDYVTPNPIPLWESPEFQINPGYQTKEVPVPNIRVPQRFTWTVQFTEKAGLLVYGDTPTNNATVGFSFNDFWERLDAGWTPLRINDVPRSDFGAYILAIPDAVIPKLTSRIYRNQYLLLSWPVGPSPYILEGKTSATATNWIPVSAPPVRVGNEWQRVLEFGKVGIFRLRRGPGYPLEITRQSNIVTLRWSTNAVNNVLQARSLLSSLDWTDLRTPAEPTNGYFQVTRRATLISELYRLRESDTAPVPQP